MTDLDHTEEKREEKELEFLCVRLEEGICGFELPCVRQLVRDTMVTPVPCVPEYYEGLCNWKGTIVPVASLCRLAGTGEIKSREEPVIMIAEAAGMQCGFLVNAEPEILRVPADSQLAGEVPERLGETVKIKAAYGMEDEVVYVVDVEWTLHGMVVYD